MASSFPTFLTVATSQMSSVSTDSPMPLVFLNSTHIDSFTKGLPIILLSNSTYTANVDAMNETKGIVTSEPLLAQLIDSNAPVSTEFVSCQIRSSTSNSSLNDTKTLSSAPCNNLPQNDSKQSLLENDQSLRHRRRAKMPGSASLICAVCGDVASRFYSLLVPYFL